MKVYGEPPQQVVRPAQFLIPLCLVLVPTGFVALALGLPDSAVAASWAALSAEP